jgi:hypothetical protein
MPGDLFDRGFMLILESMERGDTLQLILIKLFCLCVAGAPLQSRVGFLRVDERTPYNETILANVLRVNLNDFRVAMKVFQESGLVRFDRDGTLVVPWISGQVGPDPASSTLRVQQWRERHKLASQSDPTKQTKRGGNAEETPRKRADIKSISPPERGGEILDEQIDSDAQQWMDPRAVTEAEQWMDKVRSKGSGPTSELR